MIDREEEVTVYVPEGYASVAEFLKDTGLESVDPTIKFERPSWRDWFFTPRGALVYFGVGYALIIGLLLWK